MFLRGELHWLPRIGLAFFGLLPVGCGEKPAEGLFTVYDSIGVEVVFSGRPHWTADSKWSVDPTPAVVIGPEVAPDRFLHQVGDVEYLENGRLIVENRGSGELFVFDSAGVFLDAWGGEGEGPGKFKRMRGLFRCGGDQMAELEDHRRPSMAASVHDRPDITLPSLPCRPNR